MRPKESAKERSAPTARLFGSPNRQTVRISQTTVRRQSQEDLTSAGNRRSLSRAGHDVTDPCVPVEAIVADLLDAYQTGDPVARNLTLADSNVLDTPDDARAVIFALCELVLNIIRERIGDDDPVVVRGYLDTLAGSQSPAPLASPRPDAESGQESA